MTFSTMYATVVLRGLFVIFVFQLFFSAFQLFSFSAFCFEKAENLFSKFHYGSFFKLTSGAPLRFAHS